MDNQSASSDISDNFKECIHCLQLLELNYEPFNSKCVIQFKRFLHCLYSSLLQLRKNATISCNCVYQGKILLCVSQIIKSLTIFKNVLANHTISRQILWYVYERLKWCVSEIEKHSEPECSSASDSLHVCICSALQQLHTGQLSPQLIQRLIYHAVTIAKLSSPDDYNEIISVCQNILKQSSALNEDKQETTDMSLLKDSLTLSVTSLEHRVNVAVLRIFLKVFSEPNEPVKQLVRKCQGADQPRHAVDLSDLTQQLDAHIDRVTLVANFAMSCCKDIKEVNSMRCCIASVESVDNYLVPALTAFYLSRSGQDQHFAHLLCDHLQDQLVTLLANLNAVIDSYTFSKVVLEDIRALSRKLSEGESNKATYNMVGKYVWLLYKHLVKTAINESLLLHLKKAVHEYEAAINKNVPSTAVLKRVQLLIATIDDICTWLSSCAYVAENSNQIFMKTSDTHGTLLEDNKNYSPRHATIIKKESSNLEISEGAIDITTLKRIDDFTLSFNTTNSGKKLDRKLLSPYLNSATPDNRTLYIRTPRKQVQATIMENRCSSTNASFSSECDMLNLEITNILENLSILADTWQDEQSDKMTDSCVKLEQTSVVSHGGSATSIPVSEVDTLERLQDIQYLDEKIEALKFV